MVCWQAFVVADGAAAPGDPRQGPLDDPAAGQHLEGVQVIGPLDDFQRQLRLELGLGPGDELAGVSAVGPGEPDRGECFPQVPQQRPGSVAVLDAGGGDQHGQQQPDGVDSDVPLAAVDLLARVVAAAGLPDGLGCLDRLGVDDRGRGLGAAARGDPALAAQLIVHGLSRAGLLPPAGVVVDGAPVREVRGHRPPLDTLLDQVADPVDDVAAAVPRGPAALAQRPGRGRERGLGDSPFGVGHVRGVTRHPGTAADPARTAPARHGRRSLGMRGFRWIVDLHKSRSWNPRSPVPRSDTRHGVYRSLTICCPWRSAARTRHPWERFQTGSKESRAPSRAPPPWRTSRRRGGFGAGTPDWADLANGAVTRKAGPCDRP